MKILNKTWGLIFLFYFLLIITIIILAYFNLIPHNPFNIRYFDKIAHFILLGLLGYFLHRTIKRKSFYFIPIGPLIVTIFCIIDEAFQIFSTVRNSEIYDLLADLGGIIFFFISDTTVVLLKNYEHKKRGYS